MQKLIFLSVRVKIGRPIGQFVLNPGINLLEFTPEMKVNRILYRVVLILFMVLWLRGGSGSARAVGINIWGDLTTSMQSLDADGFNNEEGFSGLRSNLHIGSSIRRNLYSYTELHLNSSSDARLHQMYFTLDKLIGSFSLKTGRFALGFGLPFYYRTDNAEAGQNSLVGNTLVDPYTVQDGAELIYRGDEYSLRGALTSGTSRAGVSPKRSFGKTIRLYRYRDEFGWSVSYYASDQSFTTETTNFLVDPTSEAYGEFSRGETTTTTVTSPGKGNSLETLQVDLRYDPGSDWTANLFLGQLQDNDTSARQNKIRYYNIRYELRLAKKTTVAGQFGEAKYREIASKSPGGDTVRRFQVGLNHHYTDGTRFKLEYTKQEVDSGLAGQLDTRGPLDFSGLISQVHIKF